MSLLQRRVIIAGGGVAGLSLALMLENAGLDYLLLEAHADIAPHVGAGIGLMPNGLRILDQLGCYDTVRELLGKDTPLDKFWTRDFDGRAISNLSEMSNQFERRYGYPWIFVDPAVVAARLHKERVLVNTRVERIESVSEGVRVHTQDGAMFEGSFVAGCDGAHSVARQEMLRIARERQDKDFVAEMERDQPVAHYTCVFGIAENVPGWTPGTGHMNLGRSVSRVLVSGPNGRVYWFFHERMAEGPTRENRRFGKDEEDAFTRRHADAPVTETLTFGHVHKHKVSTSMTLLHEGVYSRWHYSRIVLVGDAAHKMNPIGGQGGNGAMESAAELVNALMAPGVGLSNGISDTKLENVFESMQQARFEGASTSVWIAHLFQSLAAYERPAFSTLLWKVACPMAGDELSFTHLGQSFVTASKLDMVPIPQRPRLIPFTDELPHEPWSTRRTNMFRGLSALAFVALGVHLFQLPAEHVSYNPERAVSGTDFMPLAKILASGLAPTLVFAVEGNRAGTGGSPLSIPFLFTLAASMIWVNSIIPFHAFLSIPFGVFLTTGRRVQPSTVKTMIEGLFSGFVLPTIMLWYDRSTFGWALATVKVAPAIAGSHHALAWAFASFGRRANAESSENHQPESSPVSERYSTSDLNKLKQLYGWVALILTAVHITSILYMPSSTDSLTKFSIAAFKELVSVPVVLYNMYTIWDARCRGYISTREACRATIGVISGHVLVGSGATWALLWAWREDMLAGLGVLKSG